MHKNICCVPGCVESGESHAVLHGFPNPTLYPERFRAWVHAVGGNIIGLQNNFIYKNRRVCHHHFEAKFLCHINRINVDAVPTLRLPGSHSLPDYSLADVSGPVKKKSSICNTSSNNPVLYDIDVMDNIGYVAEEENKENLSPNENVIDIETRHSRPPVQTYGPAGSVRSKNVIIPEMPIATSGTAACPTDAGNKMDVEDISTISAQLLPEMPIEISGTAACLIDAGNKMDVEEISTKSAQLVSEMPIEISGTAACLIDAGNKMDVEDISTKSAQLDYWKSQTLKKRRRIVAVTKLEIAMKDEIKKLKRKMYKRDAKIVQQKRELEAAKKIYSNPRFVELMENWSKPAKLLIRMQCRETKKQKTGRRFSMDEKIVALTIFKQSPKSYRYLRSIFILPSHRTLIKVISKCSLSAGINRNVFDQLKSRAEKMKKEHRLCALIFDEIHLSANTFYSERKDTVTGFVDDGTEKKTCFADHAQTFMIRGLIKNYKQPVAYTFSSSATKGVELAKQIKMIVKELQEAGFIVMCTICDQGSNNRQAVKYLHEEYRRDCLRNSIKIENNIFTVNSQEIVMLYDPPHLIKCMRNNLITKNLKYKMEGKTCVAKWQHIQELFEENPAYRGLRLIPKLTENHVDPRKISKMKVKYATQIFSRTVASNMGYLADKGVLSEDCKQTADLIYFLDNLFDSMNGSATKNRFAKPLLGPVTPFSQHDKTWNEAKKVLATMEFINKEGKKEYVPTIDGWINTIQGAKLLIRKLTVEYQITSFWMRHLNQDSIENFFGAIRSHGCRNVNPSPGQFESAFTTLLINNMSSVHAPGANCEDDNAQLLYALLPDRDRKATNQIEIEFEDLDIELKPLSSKNDVRKMAPIKYVAGYFIKRAKTKIYKSCPECKACFENQSSDEYIQYREYSKKNWLCSPSEPLLKIFSELQDITSNLIPKHIHRPYLREYIALVATVLVDMNVINCTQHREDVKKYLLNDIIKFFIFNYAKTLNKILKGHRHDVEDEIQRKALLYHEKHVKYKK